MINKIKNLAIAIISLNFAFGVVINANTESLYLGNGISCGRYTINNNSKLSDVESFCNVLGTASYTQNKIWLKIYTPQYGDINCSFINSVINQCYN